MLEGCVGAYLEAYHHDPVNKTKQNPQGEQQLPQGKAPFGTFVKATGIPKIIGAIWKDKDGNEIKGKAAYGSTVFLHIYTEALHGHELKVKLRDTKWQEADLSVTERDADGQAVESLDNTGFDAVFHRKVKAVLAEGKTETVSEGAIDGLLILEKGKEKKKDSITHYQKAKFAVFIDPLWEIQGGHDLKINPIVYHDKIEGGKADLTGCRLQVSKDDATYEYVELQGNSPVLVSDADLLKKDGKKRIDFTFGVFIDGTMNNLYDTKAREAWENDRIAKSKGLDIKGPANKKTFDDPMEHLKVYAQEKEDVAPTGNYKYGQVSYENDLSNTAILFENYKEDILNTESPIYKVYSEDMGTNTLGDKNLKVSEYKEDDVFMGSGLGMGPAGIIMRVKRAIDLIVPKITLKPDETIGTLTIDVSGFSRGAAAARHFVHEITLDEYYAHAHLTETLDVYPADHNNDQVTADYDFKAKPLPKHGWLGYLLTSKGISFDRLIIRFAALFDTVAHHGAIQKNDIRDLGLNSISKAKNILHITAGDEHRQNFSLSRIIRKNNHIELNFPGVHCDVGGSYVEGRPEGISPGVPPDPDGPHILREDTQYLFEVSKELKDFKNTLVTEGWFTDKQLYITDDHKGNNIFHRTNKHGKVTFKLESQRAYLSNQYSFIPLHIMCSYGMENDVPFDLTGLKKAKNFQENRITDNVAFLKRIKVRLKEYAEKVTENPTTDVEYEILPLQFLTIIR